MTVLSEIERLAAQAAPPLIRQMNMIAHKTSINLGLGQLMFPVDKKIKEVLQNPKDSDFRYPPNGGIKELRDAIAKQYAGTAEQAVVTIGVQEAVFDTLFALKKCGAKKVLIPNPAFGIYKKIATELGMTSAAYQLNDNFEINLDVFQNAVREKPDVVVFNFPGNPTGVGWSLSQMHSLANMLKEQSPDSIVISDEIYRQLSFDKIPSSFVEFYDDTVVVDGVSKSGAATGLRVGWTYTRNTNLSKIIEGIATTVKSCAPTINQRAAMPVVIGETTATVEGYRQALAKNFRIVNQYLTQAGISVPISTGGFYSFPDLKRGDAEQFCRDLASQENGVVIIPGKAFGAPSHVRISFATQPDTVEEGMKRFVAAYHKQ